MFLVATLPLLVILSLNVLNQSTHGQESDDSISDDSIKKDLLVSMKPLKLSVGDGDEEKFVVTVTDSDSQLISDVKIYGSIIYPDGTHKHTFQGITDENGHYVFPLTIDNKISLGELETQVKVTKPDYKPGSLSSAFSVVKASDSSPGDDLESGVQYYIQENPEGSRNEYKFLVASDYGCDSVTKGTVKAMKNKHPDLVLALGDLSEVKDPDCFFDMFIPFYKQDKLKITLGYHDTDDDGSDSSSRFSQYLSHFDMSEPFYSFDYKNIHFLAMSTGSDALIPYDEGSAQYEFVKSDLQQASTNDKTDWIIVCGYRPFYTSPTMHPAPSNLRDVYPSLFEKFGVDLVITGHNHNYQRTYPLLSDPEESNNPEIKDKSINNYENPGAPIYVTVGTAGGDLYNFGGKAPFVAKQFSETGFLDIDVLIDGKQLNAKFLDYESNSDKDYFTINKS
jgi:predicted phosphodiesterase